MGEVRASRRSWLKHREVQRHRGSELERAHSEVLVRTFGADVSHWEGDINWLLGVDYLPFVYYKATDGINGVDSQFLSNKAECDTVGMPNSPYHWWQETQDPIAQAEHFVDTVMPGYKQLIVDVEPFTYTGHMMSDLDKLLGRVEYLTGIVPSLYTSASRWNSFMGVGYPNHHPLLVAHYAYRAEPLLPMGATTWKIWQFTDMFWFSGCNATADGNWFNGNLNECRNWFGNYHPYDAPPPIYGSLHMKVIADSLNIRSGPSTSYPTVGVLKKGDVIEALDVDGTQAWVKHARGWSADKYNGYDYLTPA